MSEEMTRDEEMGGSEDDILSSLVGDGRKFKSVQDLAKGKLESDAFINKLQDENKALRALINNNDDRQRSTEIMQELLDKISKSTIQRESATDTKPEAETRNQPNSLTARDVEEVYKVMRQREREEENLKKSLSRVEERYKDKSEDFLKSKADELGLDLDMLRATARRSPNAFWNLIGENTSNVQKAPRGSVNSEAVLGLARENVRNKAYYDKVKEEMGVKAFVMDSRIQVQMHRDMMELGEAFYS